MSKSREFGKSGFTLASIQQWQATTCTELALVYDMSHCVLSRLSKAQLPSIHIVPN